MDDDAPPWTLDWFSEGRAMLDRAEGAAAVPPRYRWAYAFVHQSPMCCPERRSRFVLTRAEMDDPATRAATGGDPHLDGLTGVLANVFHPLANGNATGGAATGGSARGGHVDRDLRALIMTGQLTADATPESRVYLVKVLDALWAARLKPVAAQVPVFALPEGIATTLDIVAIAMDAGFEKTNLVNIQLKTMGSRNYTAVCGAFASPHAPRSPLLRIRDSYYMRHQLQVLVEHLMVNLNYEYGLADSFVLVVTSDAPPVWYARDAALGALAGDVLRNLRARRRAMLAPAPAAGGGDDGGDADADAEVARAAGAAYAQAVRARRSMAKSSGRGRYKRRRYGGR